MPMLSSITEIELHGRAHWVEKGRGQYLVGYDMICRIFNMGPEGSEIHTLHRWPPTQVRKFLTFKGFHTKYCPCIPQNNTVYIFPLCRLKY
jgi:hypothetical protein